MSFTRYQFENWDVITAFDGMAVHRDIYWNDITWKRKKKKRKKGLKEELLAH